MSIYASPLGSNPYKFSVYRNSAWTVQTTATKISFDTEEFDTNNNFATGTYTVPVAGFYQFNAAFNTTVMGGQTAIIYLYKNGASVRQGQAYWGDTGDGETQLVLSTLIQLAASDTVEVWQSLGAATRTGGTGATKTYFNGFLVSLT